MHKEVKHKMVAEKPSSSEIASRGYGLLQDMKCTIEFKVTVCLFHSCKNNNVYAGQNL